MKGNSFKKLPARKPLSGQEEWISKEKVMELFPTLLDRTLEEWRSKKKINYIKDKSNDTFYLEDEVRAMMEHRDRPKKYPRVRNKYIPKKLATLDNGVIVLLVVLGFVFAYFFGPWDNKSFSKFEVQFPFYLMGFFAAVYWVVRGIQMIWKRFFRKEENK